MYKHVLDTLEETCELQQTTTKITLKKIKK